MAEKEKVRLFLLGCTVFNLLAKYSYQNIVDILTLQGCSAGKSAIKMLI